MNMNNPQFFTGGYATEESICFWELQKIEGKLLRFDSISGFANPSYLTMSSDGKNLYAVSELGDAGEVFAFSLDDNMRPSLMNRLAIKGKAACHLAVSEKLLITANYLSGSLSVLSLNDDGSLNKVIDEIEQKLPQGENIASYAHSVLFIPESKKLLAANLGLDKLFVYTVDHKSGKLTELEQESISFPKGSGPRHMVRNPLKSDLLYVLCELSSQVYTVKIDAPLQVIQCISTLPENCCDENSSAAIKVSQDGRFIYASNRGFDSIAVYHVEENGQLKLSGVVKTGGSCPRDFELFDDHAVVAYQRSDLLEVFKIDKTSGLFKETGVTTEATAPVCVCSVSTIPSG